MMERKWSPMEMLMDARCINTEILTDKDLLFQWLSDLCSFIGMTPVGDVHYEDFPFPGGGKCISACQFLGESSILVHPYPEYHFIFLNIFSCKRFDARGALKWIETTLHTTEHKTFVFERGIDMETKEPIMISPTFL